MTIFIYKTGEGHDADIHMVIAATSERADELYAIEIGVDGVDDPDFEYDDRSVFHPPLTEGSYVLFCG